MSTPSPACILQTGEREWTSKGEDWKKSAQRTGQVPSTTVSLSGDPEISWATEINVKFNPLTITSLGFTEA